VGAHALEDFVSHGKGYLRGETYLAAGVELDQATREHVHTLWQSGRIKFGKAPKVQVDDAAKRRAAAGTTAPTPVGTRVKAVGRKADKDEGATAPG